MNQIIDEYASWYEKNTGIKIIPGQITDDEIENSVLKKYIAVVGGHHMIVGCRILKKSDFNKDGQYELQEGEQFITNENVYNYIDTSLLFPDDWWNGRSTNECRSALQEDYQNIIDRLLNSLNPDQRMCIILRNIEGLSYEDIAQTLNTNINTVRTRLKRAREKLLSLKEEVMSHEIQ